MSASGQNRRSDDPSFTSGLPRSADIRGVGHHFAKGPFAGMKRYLFDYFVCTREERGWEVEANALGRL
jgi:hypothetical protein